MSTPQQSGSTTTVIQQAVAENTDRRDVSGMLKRQLQQSLAFGTLVVLVIFFAIASPAFFTVSNLTTVLLSTAVIAILALGTTFVIITGGIATGVLMGLVNGVNITFLRLPPFIATLAMMMIAGGLALVISNVRPIYFSTSAPDFKRIALGVLIPGIPNAVLITIVLAIVAALVLSKTLLGRYTFAIGSNEEATRLSGVNTRRWTIFVYMFAGAFVGVAGVVIASRLDSAQPQIGMGYELQAIAAVIIGGTSLLGGRGSIIGTVIGALIMSVLVNGLSILSIQTEWRNIVVGVVVLLAVFFDSLRNRQRT
jgi:ribose transport system permease protein